jgi:hypothetical protein
VNKWLAHVRDALTFGSELKGKCALCVIVQTSIVVASVVVNVAKM